MRNWSDFSDKNVTFLTSFKISAPVQMECRSLELIPPKKDGILSLQNFSSRVAKREKGKIVQNYFFFKKGLKKN